MADILTVHVKFDEEKFLELFEKFKADHPDIVEVVRYKDCVYSARFRGVCYCSHFSDICDVPNEIEVDEKWFCADGERRLSE